MNLKRYSMMAILAAFTFLHIHAASAQTFDFTPAQLIGKLNDQFHDDKSDSIKYCKTVKAKTFCNFTTDVFKGLLVMLNNLNATSDNSAPDEGLVIYENKGKVSRITLIGAHETSFKLLYYIDQIGSISMALNPNMTVDELPKEIMLLGLGTDNEPSEEHGEILPNNVVRCVKFNSEDGLIVACDFLPKD